MKFLISYTSWPLGLDVGQYRFYLFYVRFSTITAIDGWSQGYVHTDEQTLQVHSAQSSLHDGHPFKY